MVYKERDMNMDISKANEFSTLTANDSSKLPIIAQPKLLISTFSLDEESGFVAA